MGPFSRLQSLTRRLPLGEGRELTKAPDRTPDRAVMERLARSIDSDETIEWAGWVYAGRGIAPDQPLDEAAAAITERRLVWCPTRPDADTDHVEIADLLPLRLDKHTKRLLLRTEEHDESHPDLAVIWSFTMEPIVEGLAARREAPDTPGHSEQ